MAFVWHSRQRILLISLLCFSAVKEPSQQFGGYCSLRGRRGEWGKLCVYLTHLRKKLHAHWPSQFEANNLSSTHDGRTHTRTHTHNKKHTRRQAGTGRRRQRRDDDDEEDEEGDSKEEPKTASSSWSVLRTSGEKRAYKRSTCQSKSAKATRRSWRQTLTVALTATANVGVAATEILRSKNDKAKLVAAEERRQHTQIDARVESYNMCACVAGRQRCLRQLRQRLRR